MATVLKQGPSQDPKQIPEPDIPAREPVIVPTDAPKGGKRRFVLPIVILLAALGAFWAIQAVELRPRPRIDGRCRGRRTPRPRARESERVRASGQRERQRPGEGRLAARADRSCRVPRARRAGRGGLAAARATAGGAGSNGQAQAMVEQATGQRSVTRRADHRGARERSEGATRSGAHGRACGEAGHLEDAARRRARCGRSGGGERRRASATDDSGRRNDLERAGGRSSRRRAVAGRTGGARQRRAAAQLYARARAGGAASCRASRSSRVS